MKKVFLSLATLILTILMFTFPVSAAGNGTLSLSGTEGKQGDTITVSVNLTSNPGLNTMKFAVSWGDGLELTKVSDTGLLKGFVAPAPTIRSPYTLVWMDSLVTSNSTSTGKIATLTFKIKDEATLGNHNVTLTFGESTDANGGKNTFGNATATIKATCKHEFPDNWSNNNATNHIHTCQKCDNTETQNHTWNSGEVTKQATCKEAGEKKLTCIACNATKTEAIAKTSNHEFGSWSVTKKATCTDKGEQTRSCSECSHKETKAIDALGHTFSKAVVTKEPTCTEKGTQSGTCTRCNKKATSTIKAKGHKLGEYAVTLEPTCIAEGKEEATCTVCGAKSERTVAVVDHSYGEAVITKEATATETGVSTKTCTVCGYILDEEIPSTSDLTEEDNSDDAEVDVNDDVMEEESDSDALIWIVVVLAVLAAISFLLLKKQEKKVKNQ